MDKRVQRKTRYAVVEVHQLRAINALDDTEVIKAQRRVSKEMISALEEMVNAAKAGSLDGDEALALGAAAWTAPTV
jgi:hypothetical protein